MYVCSAWQSSHPEDIVALISVPLMSSLSVVGATKEGIPILLLKEGTSQTKGKDALRNNVEAAKIVAASIKSVLGPRGMDKMLVDSMGNITITNDGATILKEMDVQHPAAKMMVEIAKSVDEEVGDGTTSSVILAGALLEKAEELIEKGIHPTIIVDGFQEAMRKSLEILDKIAEDVRVDDEVILRDIAKTSMESKIVSVDSDALAGLAVKAILAVAEKSTRVNGDNRKKLLADLDNVKVQKKPGSAMSESIMIEGIIVDKEIAYSDMPKRIKDARILLLNSPLDVEKPEVGVNINIDRPDKMKMFLDEETKMIKIMVDKISNTKADIVFCQKGIDDIGLHYLTRANISAVKNVKESDLNALAKATGARVVTNIEDLSTSDLGYAGLVEERRVEVDKWVFVERCRNPKAVSLLIRGGSQRIVDEAERSIHDALMVVKDVVQNPAIVAGGGSPEIYVSHELRKWASSIAGREHFAILAFADAVESIPITLASNAGMDIIDVLAEIRSRQSSSNPWIGVDVKELKVANMRKKKIIEPLAVKEQILKSATEAASMLLRIGHVLAAERGGKR
jgi:thermosome